MSTVDEIQNALLVGLIVWLLIHRKRHDKEGK